MPRNFKIEDLGKLAGILSFVLTLLSYIVRSFMGDSIYSYTLLVFGAVAFLGWIVWVTMSIQRLSRTTHSTDTSGSQTSQNTSVWIPEGFSIRRVFYDGHGSNLLDDLEIYNSNDAKGKYDQPLMKESPDENGIKMYRTHPEYRRLFILKRYINTFDGPDNRAIPPDTSHQSRGQYHRYIVVTFNGRVDGKPLNWGVRMRRRDGDWLRTNNNQEVVSKFTINQKTWETYKCHLGPLRCDEPCRVSFELAGGPTGSENTLYISNLQIAEVRKLV